VIDMAITLRKEDGHRYVFRYNNSEVWEFITSKDPTGCAGLFVVRALEALVESSAVNFDRDDAAKVFYMIVQEAVSQKKSGGSNDAV